MGACAKCRSGGSRIFGGLWRWCWWWWWCTFVGRDAICRELLITSRALSLRCAGVKLGVGFSAPLESQLLATDFPWYIYAIYVYITPAHGSKRNPMREGFPWCSVHVYSCAGYRSPQKVSFFYHPNHPCRRGYLYYSSADSDAAIAILDEFLLQFIPTLLPIFLRSLYLSFFFDVIRSK